MLDRYDSLFEDYLLAIALTSSQANLIDNKLGETLSLFLTLYNGDVDIYAQGSYAMGTVVKPLTSAQSSGKPGEYDVDIVLERDSWLEAVPALNGIRRILSDVYPSNIDPKLHESCERVNHVVEEGTGVSFHVDYVPIKLKTDGRNAAKRTSNDWFPSDTKALTHWFKEEAEKHIYLPAMVLMLKRIRDYAGLTDILPSIIVTALASELYDEQSTYADELLLMLDKLAKRFSVPYDDFSVTVPVLSEELGKKLSHDEYMRLQKFFSEMNADIADAIPDGDLDAIAEYLSSDFPASWKSHPDFLQSLRSKGWALQLDGTLRVVDIEGSSKEGRVKSKIRISFWSTGSQLVFRANTDLSNDKYGIRWQVLNSEKSGTNARRGGLFKAKGPSGTNGSSSNKFVNYETEKYEGEHWIKYYIYNKQTRKVQEIGRKFFVEVDTKEH